MPIEDDGAEYRIRPYAYGWEVQRSHTIKKSKDASLVGTLTWEPFRFHGKLDRALKDVQDLHLRREEHDLFDDHERLLNAINETRSYVDEIVSELKTSGEVTWRTTTGEKS